MFHWLKDKKSPNVFETQCVAIGCGDEDNVYDWPIGHDRPEPMPATGVILFQRSEVQTFSFP